MVKIWFNNHFGNRDTQTQKSKQFDIDNCVITNYDPDKKSPQGAGDMTLTVRDGEKEYKRGTSLFNDNQVELNETKYSIFERLALQDGHENDLTEQDIALAKSKFKKGCTLWNLGVLSIEYNPKDGKAVIQIQGGQAIYIDFETKKEHEARVSKKRNTEQTTSTNNTKTQLYPDETAIKNKLCELAGKKKTEELNPADLQKIREKSMTELTKLGVERIAIDPDNGIVNIYVKNSKDPFIHFEFKHATKTPSKNTTQNSNITKNDVLNKICQLTRVKNPDDLTLNEIKKARKDFDKNKAAWNKFGVKIFSLDPDAGTATITLNNGSQIRLEYSPEDAKLKPYKTYIKDVANATGYSEDLISSIILSEEYTPVPTYKNEDGGLWEYGFGHTTKTKPTKSFISKKEAVELLGKDIKQREDEIRKKFGGYYYYDNLPRPLKDAIIDVSYNRGIERLNPNNKKWFDEKYRSVHANIMRGDYEYAALRLRQETFYIYESGVRRRNVTRFLNVLDGMIKNGQITPREIVQIMDKFESDGNYYSKTMRMQGSNGKDLQRRWDKMYSAAQNSMAIAKKN